MKNFLQLTFLFALIISATQLTAQVKVGAKVGVVDATHKISVNGTLGIASVETESITGFNLGVFAEIGEGNIRFQPELLLSTKGSFRQNDSLGLADRDHKLTYLEIPLQAKYYAWENDRFSLYGLTGIYIGFAMGGKVVEEGVSTDYKFTFDDADVIGYNTRVDYGIPFGAGVNFELASSGHLFAEFRYHYGFKKVQDTELLDTGGGTSLSFNSKNRTTALNVGYMLSF